MISTQVLNIQLDYSRHASLLLVQACRDLPLEEVTKDRAASHGGMLSTLQHVYFADRIWLERLRGNSPQSLNPGGDQPPLETLAAAWPGLIDGLQQLLQNFGDDGIREPFTYRNLAGLDVTLRRWQAFLHLVNHGTLHRGQVVNMMRQAGFTPPATDMLYYFLKS